MHLLPQITEPWFVISILTGTFFIIYKNYSTPVKALLIAAMLFTFLGIISFDELISGLSNKSIITIFLLLLIASGLYKTYRLEKIFEKVLTPGRSYRYFMFGMMGLTSILSSFINNTAVVALMTPYVYSWGQKNKISPSKLLIPLSYAAIIGGMITIIGTSTTLVLNGFIESYNQPGLNQLHLFIIGISATAICIFFIGIAGWKLLPDNRDLIDSFRLNYREYVVETQVLPNSSIINKTVNDSGLRHLDNLFLAEIIRGKDIIKPVSPETILKANDFLIFAGATERIIDITNSDKGIVIPNKPQWASEDEVITEAVISHNSSQIGSSIRHTDFRNRYDSAVIGVFRNGEKINGKIGDVILNAGDALLMISGKDFKEKADLYSDLFIISSTKDIPSQKRNHRPILLLILGVVGLILSGLISIVSGLSIILAYMVITNHITVETFKREFDLNLASILILSLALGKAMVNSGAGLLIADGILSVSSGFGAAGILIGIVLLTLILTTFITNVAAVSIAFPIAYQIAQTTTMNPDLLYLAVAFTASAAFLSPLSYQTNLMIYGPGSYKFKDFIRVGTPVTILYLATVILCLLLLY